MPASHGRHLWSFRPCPSWSLLGESRSLALWKMPLWGGAQKPPVSACIGALQRGGRVLMMSAIHGCAHAERCQAHTSMTRPLSSSNDGFLLDFARLFVYRTAIEQEITTAASVIAF